MVLDLTHTLIPNPEDGFRIWYHQPARRMSEAEIRLAKQSSGFRMTSLDVIPGLVLDENPGSIIADGAE